MATVATEDITRAGVEPTLNPASAGGDEFTPGNHTFVLVRNASGSSVTATIPTTATSDDMAVADITVAVPAGEDRVIGPLPHRLVAGSNGLGDITWSATTSVSFAVLDAS